MNNPNPFVPKGSLLEQQSQRRSRLKLTVFCVLAVSVTGLVAMLIQGCKRERPDTEQTPPPLDFTNAAPTLDTNPPALSLSNPPVEVPPFGTNSPTATAPVPPVAPVEPLAPVTPAAPASGSEYTIAKGDTLAVIAKKNGVSLSALQSANPGLVPTKLKIGQKIVIPAGGLTSSTTAPAMAVESGLTVYTVKSGDTLTSIAKKHGTSVKAIESANGLTTTKIKVGQKLKLPVKGEAAVAAPAPAPAPVVETAPALPPISAPAPAPTK